MVQVHLLLQNNVVRIYSYAKYMHLMLQYFIFLIIITTYVSE